MALTTSRLRRTAAVAALPTRALARSLGIQAARLTGADRSALQQRARAATAADTRRVLGDLKGGALKLGQLLSTVDALLPQDPESSWEQALAALQQDNPGLPFAEIEPVLVAELGWDWRSLFGEFDEQPVAAASIGQVHRGTWADGRPVAVKIQYPGIAEAIAADVRSLSLALTATALVARSVAMPPLVAELRTRLREELDYRREARHQAAFAAAYTDDPEFRVPAVVHATGRVLVSEWQGGVAFADLAAVGNDRAAGPGGAAVPAVLPDVAQAGGPAAHRPAPRQLPPDGRRAVGCPRLRLGPGDTGRVAAVVRRTHRRHAGRRSGCGGAPTARPTASSSGTPRSRSRNSSTTWVRSPNPPATRSSTTRGRGYAGSSPVPMIRGTRTSPWR